MSRVIKQKLPKLHAIQLVSVDVIELYIRLQSSSAAQAEIKREDISVFSGHNTYDEESKTIQVRIKIEVGMEKASKFPFVMRVELGGMFRVDEERFPIEHLEHWASKNAPMILFPYMREHVFALTARCGLPPMILPLVEVPTLVMESPKSRVSRSKKGEA
jgi:preprotein translocase subunit SecB